MSRGEGSIAFLVVAVLFFIIMMGLVQGRAQTGGFYLPETEATEVQSCEDELLSFCIWSLNEAFEPGPIDFKKVCEEQIGKYYVRKEE